MEQVKNPDDFAVVIGISHYPFLGDLDGPVDKAKAIAKWLTSPSGGGLPFDHVRLLISNETAKVEKEKAKPTIDDVNAAFVWLVEKSQQQGRIGRRLYIYLAGHGYEVNRQVPALLMANASFETLDYSIDAMAYGDSFLYTMFREVVLFVDCALTEHQGRPSIPPWAMATLITPPTGTPFFYASSRPLYRARSPFTNLEIESHGFLTQALLDGLRGDAADADGRITSETLIDYLPDRLDELTDKTQQVVFERGESPIVFVDSVEEAHHDQGATQETISNSGSAKRTASASQQSKAAVEASHTKVAQPKRLDAERVATQADDPAHFDELYRRPFAEVIGMRMGEVWKAQSEKQNGGKRLRAITRLFKRRDNNEQKNGGDHTPVGAFMIHIHGPWGAGKTSVLNFLRQHLKDERRPSASQWVVVDFNAWRNQRIRPPWWTLIKEVYTQTARQLGLIPSLWLRLQWLFWRARADWIPVLLTVLLILGVVLVATGVINLGPHSLPINDSAPAKSASDEMGKAVELGLKILGAVGVAAATVFAFSRSLVFGSARAAQTYTELRSDPLGPIVRLFNKLVNATGRPVAVFIDDLDRCESKYVIELLEGIQTLFRTAPVTYVVAADRKWICSSFEKGFEDFGKTIGGPGRPLGYLFLDKVFQVSASIPRLTPEVQLTYMNGLLRATASVDPKVLDETRKQAEREALETVKDAHTQEELEEKIAEVQNDPVKEPAMRAAAARQITRPEAQRRTEHRLQRFASLL
ncbi:MAG: hypothetical protein V7641_3310 [Blastocatellia bacterium]